jgi:hypothetical protein
LAQRKKVEWAKAFIMPEGVYEGDPLWVIPISVIAEMVKRKRISRSRSKNPKPDALYEAGEIVWKHVQGLPHDELYRLMDVWGENREKKEYGD